MTVGQELLDVPFPAMLKSMGLAIAQAQMEIDLVSIHLAQVMAGQEVKGNDGKVVVAAERVKFGDDSYSLLELGFTPTFYQFVDTIIEVKISISTKQDTDVGFSVSNTSGSFGGTLLGFYNKGSMSVSTVSASFAAKYQYSSEGSSLLRTKLVPVPPPAILQERIRKLINTPPPPHA